MHVLISQRVDVLPDRDERRDALDQAWTDTLSILLGERALICPMPNRFRDVDGTIAAWAPSLIVLSGGNDIGSAPERDRTEEALLVRAEAERIPVLAVCRGMQMMQHYLGGRLERVEGHVARQHAVGAAASEVAPAELLVNSFHAWAIPGDGLAEGLEPTYLHADGTVEAARHVKLPWLAVMWHPERAGKGMSIANDWLARWLGEVL